MKIIWAEQAQRAWIDRYRFYFARNPEAARHMRQLVIEAAEQLRQYPRMGKPGRIEGNRELVITGTPFLLVYDENPARVEILHVYDGRQNLLQNDE